MRYYTAINLPHCGGKGYSLFNFQFKMKNGVRKIYKIPFYSMPFYPVPITQTANLPKAILPKKNLP